MKKLSFILLFLLLGMNSVFAENNYGFTYQDKAINPACIAMFNNSVADYPYIRSINLNVCQTSNAAAKNILKRNDGSYYFYNNDKDDQEGQYGYKVIGKTTSGVYVVETNSSGGGTLVAFDLLLLRLDNSNEYVYPSNPQPLVNKIIELKLLGYVRGGDRCVGGFAKVQVIGTQLKIKQYKDDYPSGECKKTKEYSINLTF